MIVTRAKPGALGGEGCGALISPGGDGRGLGSGPCRGRRPTATTRHPQTAASLLPLGSGAFPASDHPPAAAGARRPRSGWACASVGGAEIGAKLRRAQRWPAVGPAPIRDRAASGLTWISGRPAGTRPPLSGRLRPRGSSPAGAQTSTPGSEGRAGPARVGVWRRVQ